MAEAAARRILVTGASGFVGGWLAPALRRRFGDGCEIFGASVNGKAVEGQVPVSLDLMSRESVEAAVRQVRPTACVHLAGVTHVVGAADAPTRAWEVNLRGTMFLAEALLAEAPDCRLVHVSSGEVYGLSANRFERLNEDCPLAPANLYAVTKAAADLAIGEMALRGLKAVRFRPFNHTGPGQPPDFVTPGVAAQLARAEAPGAEPRLRIGATDRARDFLDVRDVCEAYAAAIARFDDLPAGQIFNLASGQSRTIQSILDDFLRLARRPMVVEVDRGRIRPNDVARICGDAGLAERTLGWKSVIPWEQTVADMLAYWRDRVSKDAMS